MTVVSTNEVEKHPPVMTEVDDHMGIPLPPSPLVGCCRHLIANGLDVQKAEDPLMSVDAQHFHNACTSWVTR